MQPPRFVFATLLSIAVLAGCSDNGKKTVDPTLVQCNDGVDNDADGMVDFPEDPGCTSATDESEDTLTAPQCNDGRDNDSDGKTDFPNDPGCSSPNQDDEVDDCPGGTNCPQCANGVDDDGNGSMDYPGDVGCTSASDNDESQHNPAACGVGLTIKPLPASGDDTGTFGTTSTSQVASGCGEMINGPAIAYEVLIATPTILVASTDNAATTADTVVDIRSSNCSAPTSELMCNDDVDTTAGNVTSTVTASVQPGVYFIIVKGHDVTETGDYALHVDRFVGEGVACTLTAMCGPGLVCRIPHGQTAMVCAKPVCSDTIDDDGDGKIDFPNDPGCETADDSDETDDCPSGPNCPKCSNTVDDDNDGTTDYPMDMSCPSAAGASESCAGEEDPIIAITAATTMGTLIGAHDNHTPNCDGIGGEDVLYTLTIPALQSLRIDTDGSATDTILSLLAPSCAEPSLECDDEGGSTPGSSLITHAPIAAGTYIVAIDDWYFAPVPDTFNIHVSGILLTGASCEPAATLGGALTCGASDACAGTVGSRTCVPSACSNGVDDDGDGFPGYPTDPGCTSLADNDETDDCPAGPMCPVCGNTIDDDGDGSIDYPADSSCTSASGTSEATPPCNEMDPVVTIAGPTTSGTLVAAHNDFQYAPSCSGLPGASGLDKTFVLNIPAVTALTIGTTGGTDVVVALLNTTCAEPNLGCDDEGGASFGDALFTTGPIPSGTYLVVVDGWRLSSAGAFDLHVSGTLPVGASCEPANTLGGALTCATTCGGTAGSQTCQ